MCSNNNNIHWMHRFRLYVDYGDSVGLSGGASDEEPNSIVAVVEFASAFSKIKTERGKTLEVMPAAEEAYTLADFISVANAGGSPIVPDVILGLDILAGADSANRLSISWAHERIRICMPSSSSSSTGL